MRVQIKPIEATGDIKFCKNKKFGIKNFRLSILSRVLYLNSTKTVVI